jgi:predicted esterase
VKPRFLLVSVCFLLVLSVSCSNFGPGQPEVSPALPKTGVIHEKVSCAVNKGNTYALYIPVEKKLLYPVIVVFDPHGNGVLPLTLYKGLADKYKFILIGSNNSKNGISTDEVNSIVAGLMHEVRHRYPVDTNNICLLGFSGGARVAAMTAMYQVPVRSIIGCGAGFGATEQPVRFNFDYYGMAGTADFNMNEMLQLDQPLTRAGIRHCIAAFRGKHEWPPAAVMEDAVKWTILNNMRDGRLKPDPDFLDEVNQVFISRIDELKTNKHLMGAADACREAIVFLNGVAPVEVFKQDLAVLEKMPEYQSQVAYYNKLMKQEELEKQELINALQTKDLNWWKDKIKQYNFRVTTGGEKGDRINPEDTLKDCRLMAFLSLFCYMNANAALSQQNGDVAARIISIYELADPGNPEANYMNAMVLARRLDTQPALTQLSIAAAKGFSDKERLMRQAEFGTLKNSPQWFDLMKTMK